MTEQAKFPALTHPFAPARAAASQRFAAKRVPVRFSMFLAALAIAFAAFVSVSAQDQNEAQAASQRASANVQIASSVAPTPMVAFAELPDDPSVSLFPEPATASDSDSGRFPGMGAAPKPTTRREERAASLHTKYIPAGWSVVHPLPAKDKVLLGLNDTYDVRNLATIFLAAGYEHLLNGQPNYGVNSEAFAKRLGASAIRGTTEGVFTDSVFAPLLHEDPRYYVEGPDYSLVHRTLYSITRPLITRTDSGHESINGSLLLGYASASALSYTYYPQINKNFHDTAATFGGAIGGAALGFFVSEFSTEVLQKLHLNK